MARSSANTSAKSPPVRRAVPSTRSRTAVSRRGPSVTPVMVRGVTIAPGLKGTAAMTVASDHTAIAIGSGDVEVLSHARTSSGWSSGRASRRSASGWSPPTPRSACRCSSSTWPPRPSADGSAADAVLETVRGRRLAFKVSAHDEHGLVGAGRITRVIVDRERFLERATRATDVAPPARS